MKTAEEYFKEYSSLYQFEEGSPEYLIDKEDFISIMKKYGEEMYNQAIDDAIKYGQVRCTTNVSSVTASIYGTVAGESFKIDEQTLQKLKKQ